MKLFSLAGKAKAIDLGLYHPVLRQSPSRSQTMDAVSLRVMKKRRDISPFDMMSSRKELFDRKDSGGHILHLNYKSQFDKYDQIKSNKEKNPILNRLVIKKQKQRNLSCSEQRFQKKERRQQLYCSSNHNTYSEQREQEKSKQKMNNKIKGIMQFKKQSKRADLFKQAKIKATIDCPQSYDYKLPLKLPDIKFKKQIKRSFYDSPAHATGLDYSPNYNLIKQRLDNVGPQFDKQQGRNRSVGKAPELGNFERFDYSKIDLLKPRRSSLLDFDKLTLPSNSFVPDFLENKIQIN